MSETGKELSHFEQLAAQTPKKTPYAILIGAALFPIVFVFLNWIAPNEAIKDARDNQKKTQDTAAEVEADVAPMGAEEVEDI